MKRRIWVVVPKLVLALAMALGALTVWAPKQVESQARLRAQVFITQRRIPRGLTEQGLVRFARRYNARRLEEGRDQPIAQRQWQGEMVTAFNRPPGDLEFHVLFYDVQDGPRRFVQDMSTLVNDRSQKTFLQRLRLDRGEGRHAGFQPNRRLELVVTVRRQEVARHQMTLSGEEVQRSGQVSFGEDETR